MIIQKNKTILQDKRFDIYSNVAFCVLQHSEPYNKCQVLLTCNYFYLKNDYNYIKSMYDLWGKSLNIDIMGTCIDHVRRFALLAGK